MEKIREGRGLGCCLFFWGVWKGIRNRKGGGCVYGFGVFGQGIGKRRGRWCGRGYRVGWRGWKKCLKRGYFVDMSRVGVITRNV